MQQTDCVGDVKARKFKDIRNTRPTNAEENSAQLLRLGELINKIPDSIKSGGTVDQVRSWKKDRDAAAKIAGNSKSSANEITAAIHNIGRWWK